MVRFLGSGVGPGFVAGVRGVVGPVVAWVGGVVGAVVGAGC